jgi:hypothetical protein
MMKDREAGAGAPASLVAGCGSARGAGDLAGFEALGADAELAGMTVDEGADGLEVGELAALGSLQDPRSATAFLLEPAPPGDAMSCKRVLTADLTDT